jgi:hypothetical protein
MTMWFSQDILGDVRRMQLCAGDADDQGDSTKLSLLTWILLVMLKKVSRVLKNFFLPNSVQLTLPYSLLHRPLQANHFQLHLTWHVSNYLGVTTDKEGWGEGAGEGWGVTGGSSSGQSTPTPQTHDASTPPDPSRWHAVSVDVIPVRATCCTAEFKEPRRLAILANTFFSVLGVPHSV